MKLDITTLPIKAEEFFSYLENKIGYKEATLNNVKSIILKRFYPILIKERGDTSAAYEQYEVIISKLTLSKNYKKYLLINVMRFLNYLEGKEYKIQFRSNEYIKENLVYFNDLFNDFLNKCKSYNKENTLRAKMKFISKYLYYLEANGITSPKQITIESTLTFLNEQVDKNCPSAIKEFLAYLYDNGQIDIALHLLIKLPRKPQVVPSVYTLEEIERIEKEFDKNTEACLRDYCMFLLASELGIRIGDITNLKFNNIDFKSNYLTFKQIKTGVELKLPLSEKFITNFNLYVSKYRKDNLPYLFITTVHPLRQISICAINSHLTRVMSKAGIIYNSRKHGPHSFRSSLVSNMINNEIPYEVVRKVVGHTSETAIKHYAKIDIERLRIYAIDPLPLGKTITNILDGDDNV